MAAKKNLKESRGRKWSEVELRSTFMRPFLHQTAVTSQALNALDDFNISSIKTANYYIQSSCWHYAPRWISIISCVTRARGIVVNWPLDFGG